MTPAARARLLTAVISAMMRDDWLNGTADVYKITAQRLAIAAIDAALAAGFVISEPDDGR